MAEKQKQFTLELEALRALANRSEEEKQQAIEAQRAAVASAEEEKRRAAEQMDELEAQKAGLMLEMERVKQQRAETEMGERMLQEEREKLREELGTIADLKMQREAVQTEFDRLKSELQEKHDDFVETSAKTNSLLYDRLAAQERVNTLKEEEAEMLKRKESAERETEEAQANLATVQKRVQALDRRAQEEMEKVEIARTKLQGLENTMKKTEKDLEEKKATLEQDIFMETERMKSLREQTALAEQIRLDTERSIAGFKNQAAAAAAKLEELHTNIAHLHDEEKDLKSSIETLAKERSQLSAEWFFEKSQMDKERLSLQTAIQEATRRLDQLEMQDAAVSKSLAKANRTLVATVDVAKEMKRETEYFKDEREIMHTAKSHTEEELQNVRGAVAQKEAELDEILRKVAEAKAQQQELERQTQRLELLRKSHQHWLSTAEVSNSGFPAELGAGGVAMRRLTIDGALRRPKSESFFSPAASFAEEDESPGKGVHRKETGGKALAAITEISELGAIGGGQRGKVGKTGVVAPQETTERRRKEGWNP